MENNFTIWTSRLLHTPGLLFPAVSLLLLAYTNRFLTLATIIRSLHDQYHASRDENLRYRIRLIRNMQIYGVWSLIFFVASMFALFAGSQVGNGVLPLL